MSDVRIAEAEFDAQLRRLEGKIKWTVFYVPFSVSAAFGTNSRVNVKAVINGHPFSGVLLPSRNGHYLAFNQAMKAATGKALGDTVHVRLAADMEPRVVEIPEDILAALNENEAARAAFDALPDYIKRGEISRVTDAKTEATRHKRRQALLNGLLERTGG
jgi:hypothetical protein